MAQNRRIRANRYRKIFAEFPIKGKLLLETIEENQLLKKPHRKALEGKSSNSYLYRIGCVFGTGMGRYLCVGK